MEPPRDESPEWDKTTASIASLSSSDLHDSRPNRWHGHRSTWRTLTQDDRAVYDALTARRNGDLAVHLYNAFALKGRRLRIGGQGELGEYEEDENRWVPPTGWTAWPLSLRDLPPDDFMPVQPLDEDSAFTFRKRQRVFPRNALAEEVEASILRLANQKFTARGWNERSHGVGSAAQDAGMKDNGSDGEDDVKPRQSTEADSSDSEMGEPDSESEDDADSQSPGPRIVPTADDDASAAILKPAVGDIISKLEKTLTVLHNMMAATVQTTNDADEDDEDGEETGLDEPSPRSQSRARSRSRRRHPVKRPRLPSEALQVEPDEPTPQRSPQKKPRHASASPAPAADEDPPPSSASTPSPSPEQPPERILRRRAIRLNRLTPRDWRAALGAASLAGFPPAAVHRAAQRCADLFGGRMELRALNDHSPSRDTNTEIFPGGRIKLEEGTEDDGEAAQMAAMRLAARDASRADEPSRSNSRTARSRTTSRTRRSQTPAGSRSRSRSRSATPHLVCPYRTCPRSVESFSRRGNLVRHVELVHGGDGAGVLGMEVDSEDEVEGGVHVDGFLRGVRVRRGWRGVDVREEGERQVERGERGREGGRERGTERRARKVKVEDEGYYYPEPLDEALFH